MSSQNNSKDTDNREIERINKKKVEELAAFRQKLNQKNLRHNHENKPVDLTDSNFVSELAEHDVLVVDFWAPWCGPCRVVGPIIEQLASDYAGRVTFGKLNVDENPRIGQSFRVQSIPTILVFYKGKAMDSIIGAVPRVYIENKFKPFVDPKHSSSIYR